MPTIDETIAQVQQQEKDLQFTEFTAETALEIGVALAARAKKENLTLSVDIRLNGHELFHYSAPGTSPDNDEWMRYKRNTVNRFHVSSYLYGLNLRKNNRTLADIGLSPTEYAPWGGGFPITVKNVGVVGTIAVSGLRDDEDHGVIVWAIEQQLKGKQKNNPMISC